MKSFKPVLLFIAAAAFFFCSCGSKKTAGIAIPKDAAVAIQFNTASLSKKLSWNDIKASELYKNFEKEIADKELTTLQKNLLENPENSGIDLNSNLTFFYEAKGKYGYAVFQGKLSDPQKFETTIKELAKNSSFSKSGDINYAGEEDNCLTWNKERFMIVNGSPVSKNDNDFSYNDDENVNSLNLDSLVKYAKSIYDLKASSSLGNDDRFSSLLKETGDVHIFYKPDGVINENMGALKMLKAGSILKGNAAGMAVNFENGKASVNSKNWYGKELSAFMKKYEPENLDASMLKRVPSDNLAAMLAFKYPPKALQEFLKLLGVDGLLNMFTAQMGISVDDFVKANKGDVLLAVSDFAVKEKTSSIAMGDGEPFSFTSTAPDANFIFATSVNDKAAFTKLVDVVKSEITKQDSEEALNKVKYAFNDNWLVLGNQQIAVDGFATGNSNSTNPLTSQITGHPFGGFIDFQKIAAGLPKPKEGDEETMNEIDTETVSKLAANWENMIFYGGEFKNNATIGHYEINLKDKNTNSLKQLFNFLSSVANEKIKKENDWEREFNKMDSTKVLPNIPLDTPAKSGTK